MMPKFLSFGKRDRDAREFARWHHLEQESVEQGGDRMTIFPARILLATDGSREAELAATTAVDLAKRTDSELHVIYVEPALPMIADFADPGPERTEPESRRLLDEQVERIREAGGTVAEAHLRLGRRTTRSSRLARSWAPGW